MATTLCSALNRASRPIGRAWGSPTLLPMPTSRRELWRVRPREVSVYKGRRHRCLGSLTTRKYLTSAPRASPTEPTQPTQHLESVAAATALRATLPSTDGSTPAYRPPKTGVLSVLPATWVPYAELLRIDKPTGAYYLLFPCLFSTLMAAPMATPAAGPGAVVGTSALFLVGALVMRGAGCTINDLWDRDLDPHVARTRLRPIARGAISPFGGLVFTGAQLLVGLAVLLQFPPACFFYAAPSLLLVATYPLAKRVTYYPQFVLGLTFSWGAMVGFPALGVDLVSLSPTLSANTAALSAAGLLYASNVAWTVLYDMIYAHMDVRDDAQAGIKSIALKHGGTGRSERTKQLLAGLAAVQVGLLAGAGVAAGAGPAFFVGSCGGALVTLGVMIRRVDLESVEDCWWWFVNGCWMTGGIICLGLGVDYAVRYTAEERETNDDTTVE